MPSVSLSVGWLNSNGSEKLWTLGFSLQQVLRLHEKIN